MVLQDSPRPFLVPCVEGWPPPGTGTANKAQLLTLLNHRPLWNKQNLTKVAFPL